MSLVADGSSGGASETRQRPDRPPPWSLRGSLRRLGFLAALAVLAVVVLKVVAALPEWKAASRGKADARADIERRRPRILFLGTPVTFGEGLGDDGLFRESAGCIVSDESEVYVEAYDAEIRRARAEGRLEGMLVEPARIDDLERLMAERRPFVVRESRVSFGTDDGRRVDVWAYGGSANIAIVDGADGEERRATAWFVTEGDEIWLRDDGRTLVVRRPGAEPELMTYDLEWGRFMQRWKRDRDGGWEDG